MEEQIDKQIRPSDFCFATLPFQRQSHPRCCTLLLEFSLSLEVCTKRCGDESHTRTRLWPMQKTLAAT
jgi:hypothetical protein